MRIVKITFRDRDNLYVRRASQTGSTIEIQGQRGGVILYRPKLKRSLLLGVVLVDENPWISGVTQFSEKTPGFESNQYTVENYRG